jgi:hypothetical protein
MWKNVTMTIGQLSMAYTSLKAKLSEVTSTFFLNNSSQVRPSFFNSNVIWAADTNYRIDLENDVVRGLASSDDLDLLFAADQVRWRSVPFTANANNSAIVTKCHGLPSCLCGLSRGPNPIPSYL